MRFWPFSSSKKSRLQSTNDHTLLEKGDPGAMARQGREGATRRTTSRQIREEKPRKLSKPRTDSYQSDPRSPPRSQTTPLSSAPSGDPEKTKYTPPVPTRRTSNLYHQNPVSQSSIGPENFSAVPAAPTLYAKRPDYDPSVSRKKSSKRKADEYAREREIAAMSSPIPIPKPKRPATYSGSGPLARDTRSVPGDLNRHLARPASQISLPRQEDLEGPASSQSSFRIGALSALSPRPTLKYDSNPRSVSGKQPARQATTEPLIEEEDTSYSKKRIDDLADDLDSSGIRELMERDRRRREKKREADKAKLQRKLQRRADRQHEDETRRARAQDFASQSSTRLRSDSAQRGEVDDGAPGPAVDEGGPAPSPEPPTQVAASSPLEDPFVDPIEPSVPASRDIRNPFADEKDLDVMHEPSDHEDEHGPPIPIKSPLRKAVAGETHEDHKPAQAALSPPTSPPQAPADTQSFSQSSALGRNVTPEVVESIERDRRSSDQSSQHLSSWTSFFRRGGRQKSTTTDRGRATPSEFSNTSRESFARKQPVPIVPPGRTFRRSDSATPQRTMSKFREDLPEFPISPPDSRVQSPEVAASSLSSKQVRQSLSGTLDTKSLATSSSNPTLDRGRPDSRLQTGQTGETELTTPEPSGHALSQSLASVDSEASWLSGRPPKRSSGLAGQSVRHSGASMTPQPPGAFEPEEDDIVKDEYLNRLTLAPVARRESAVSVDRKASSTIIDFQKEREPSPAPEVPALPEAKEEKWHAGVARQPTVVRQARQAKSKEGLLKEYEDENNHSSGDEDESPLAEEPVELMRAKSVDYKGHVRHVSAGSARLLDIRRSSTVSNDTPPRTPTFPKAGAVMGEQQSASTPKL